MFDAIVFAVTDLGFVARSARQEDDGGEFRLAKMSVFSFFVFRSLSSDLWN